MAVILALALVVAAVGAAIAVGLRCSRTECVDCDPVPDMPDADAAMAVRRAAWRQPVEFHDSADDAAVRAALSERDMLVPEPTVDASLQALFASWHAAGWRDSDPHTPEMRAQEAAVWRRYGYDVLAAQLEAGQITPVEVPSSSVEEQAAMWERQGRHDIAEAIRKGATSS